MIPSRTSEGCPIKDVSEVGGWKGLTDRISEITAGLYPSSSPNRFITSGSSSTCISSILKRLLFFPKIVLYAVEIIGFPDLSLLLVICFQRYTISVLNPASVSLFSALHSASVAFI